MEVLDASEFAVLDRFTRKPEVHILLEVRVMRVFVPKVNQGIEPFALRTLNARDEFGIFLDFPVALDSLNQAGTFVREHI